MNAGKFWLAVGQALTIAGIIWIARSERAMSIDIAILKEHVCRCGQMTQPGHAQLPRPQNPKAHREYEN